METEYNIQDNLISEEKKYIQLDQTFVLLYIFALLDTYDKANTNKKNIPKLNPYSEPILLKTNNGKYVEIPKNAQMYAITKWNEIKTYTDKKSEEKQEEKQDQNDDTDDEGKTCIACRKDKINPNGTLIDTTFQLIICLIIIFTILYTLSLARKGIMYTF